jgi:hypothetical protein
LESSKELQKNYRTLPPTIIDIITDGLRLSESSRELEKNHKTLSLEITNGITNKMKFHRRILGGVGNFWVLLKNLSFNYQQNYRLILKINKNLIVQR